MFLWFIDLCFLRTSILSRVLHKVFIIAAVWVYCVLQFNTRKTSRFHLIFVPFIYLDWYIQENIKDQLTFLTR